MASKCTVQPFELELLERWFKLKNLCDQFHVYLLFQTGFLVPELYLNYLLLLLRMLNPLVSDFKKFTIGRPLILISSGMFGH